jgi:multidrug efflux pump subunit AcrA (membrane-fusion protein)
MRRVVRWIAGVAVIGVGASVGTVALADALSADPATRYRLATASTGDVARTVSTNGSVDFVNRADVSFGVAGTLASLSVRPGQRVSAGQRLGALDTAALRAAVDSAEADLATAKATLANDQQRQADAVDSESEADSDADSGADSRADSGADTPPSGQLAKQQQAVRAAQTAASKAIAAAKAALSAQQKACGTTSATTPATDAQAEVPAACTRALAAATRAQDAVAKAQEALQKRIGELARTLSESASESASDPESESPSDSSSDSPSEEDTTDPSKGDESAPTAATIADDQAAVDAAEVDLAAAERSLAQATLTAPIAGTVASVAAAAGEAVSAGSAVVVLIGDGAAVVETTVPVERIDEIEVGQRATVTPSGARDGVSGQVTRIGRLAEESDSEDTEGADDSVVYPVTVTVDEPTAAMPAGSTAAVDIEVDTAEGVLTVPTSAVHGQSPATVTVLAGTQSSPREVTVGIVGPLRTQITGGLAAGEQVVLADLDAPLPSAEDQMGPDGGPGGLGGGPVVKEGPKGGPVRGGR